MKTNKVRCKVVMVNKWIMAVLLLFVVQHGKAQYYSFASDGGGMASDVAEFLANWMSYLPDNRQLSRISIPGTHDTMAINIGGPNVATQSMSLETQLQSGVRYLDIRLRCQKDSFPVHHDLVWLGVYFDDVMNTVTRFLASHPRETVFMKIQDEYTKDPVACKDGDHMYDDIWYNSGYLREFLKKFDRWKGWFSAVGSPRWPTVGDSGYLPVMGDVRGRVVLLRGKGLGQFQLGYWWPGGTYAWSDDMEVQDSYQMYVTSASIDSKRRDIYYYFKYNAYDRENSPRYDGRIVRTQRIGVNALNGSGGGYPFTFASGKLFTYQNPTFDGMNTYFGEIVAWELEAGRRPYLGIVPADYPSVELIHKIVRTNF
ncbi:MAG: hypothetical protein JNN30_04735 [Rhodanobacteraceae bacterium]|nr:hypothetical protein [Rhodanobacteraceae bacterium]